ncbi:MAG: hypothetical protein ACOZB0_13765 [Pseudomonadota bacterium]
MAEIKNDTLNFSSGRATRLTFAVQRLACTEIELRQRSAGVVPSREVF